MGRITVGEVRNGAGPVAIVSKREVKLQKGRRLVETGICGRGQGGTMGKAAGGRAGGKEEGLRSGARRRSSGVEPFLCYTRRRKHWGTGVCAAETGLDRARDPLEVAGLDADTGAGAPSTPVGPVGAAVAEADADVGAGRTGGGAARLRWGLRVQDAGRERHRGRASGRGTRAEAGVRGRVQGPLGLTAHQSRAVRRDGPRKTLGQSPTLRRQRRSLRRESAH